MWVEFKIKWQDGLYKYDPGKVVELPNDMGFRYCESGKAKPAKAPKWASQRDVKAKANEYPSARRRIRKSKSRLGQQESLSDLASMLIEDDD